MDNVRTRVVGKTTRSGDRSSKDARCIGMQRRNSEDVRSEDGEGQRVRWGKIFFICLSRPVAVISLYHEVGQLSVRNGRGIVPFHLYVTQ